MNVHITHDDKGTITSIGVPAPKYAANLKIKSTPGHTTLTLDVPEIEHPGHFIRYLSDFRVDTKSNRPKLVRKQTTDQHGKRHQ